MVEVVFCVLVGFLTFSESCVMIFCVCPPFHESCGILADDNDDDDGDCDCDDDCDRDGEDDMRGTRAPHDDLGHLLPCGSCARLLHCPT